MQGPGLVTITHTCVDTDTIVTGCGDREQVTWHGMT